MPGSVSDSYDPEWGTSSNCTEIDEALSDVYKKISELLGNREPIFILDLVRSDLPRTCTATLSEREWRLLRFALERAKDSL